MLWPLGSYWPWGYYHCQGCSTPKDKIFQEHDFQVQINQSTAHKASSSLSGSHSSGQYLPSLITQAGPGPKM